MRRRRLELRGALVPVCGRQVNRQEQEDPDRRRRAIRLPEPHQGQVRLRLRRYRRPPAPRQDAHPRPHVHPGAAARRRPALPRHGAARLQALRRRRDRGDGGAAARHVPGRDAVRALGGHHSSAGVGARDSRRDRRGAALQARRQAADDPLQPLRPRPLRSRRLRGLPGRQAAGLRVPGREGRGGAQAAPADQVGITAPGVDRLMTTVDVRRLRLGAAFVLLTYLTLHLSNHALGLVSLQTMEAGQRWFIALWRSALGTLALYGAFTVHGVLALWLLYRRGSLRMPAWEAAQYGLGLALPALLAIHVVGTRIAWWRLGADERRVGRGGGCRGSACRGDVERCGSGVE